MAGQELQGWIDQWRAGYNAAFDVEVERLGAAMTGHDSYACTSSVPGGNRLPFALGSLLLVSGTSEQCPGPARIQVSTAPSTSHAAQIASSPQLTTAGLPIAGEFPGYSPQTPAWYMSAKPAIHAPAHAAIRSQLRGRQPRRLMNPAISTGRGRASAAAVARTTAICTATESVLHPSIPRLTSAQVYGLVVM